MLACEHFHLPFKNTFSPFKWCALSAAYWFYIADMKSSGVQGWQGRLWAAKSNISQHIIKGCATSSANHSALSRGTLQEWKVKKKKLFWANYIPKKFGEREAMLVKGTQAGEKLFLAWAYKISIYCICQWLSEKTENLQENGWFVRDGLEWHLWKGETNIVLDMAHTIIPINSVSHRASVLKHF